MNPEQLKRSRSSRTPKDHILVVGSSHIHEQYVRWLRQRLDKHPLPFELADADPVEQLKQTARLARSEKLKGSGWQQVWALVDGVPVSEIPRLQKEARASGVRVVASNPTFETWLMFHLAADPVLPDEASLSDALCAVAPTLNGPFSGYEEGLAGRYEIAKARAIAATSARLGVGSNAFELVEGVLSSLAGFHGRPWSGTL